MPAPSALRTQINATGRLQKDVRYYRGELISQAEDIKRQRPAAEADPDSNAAFMLKQLATARSETKAAIPAVVKKRAERLALLRDELDNARSGADETDGTAKDIEDALAVIKEIEDDETKFPNGFVDEDE